MENIYQIYQAEIKLYKGSKINLGGKRFGYLLKFNPDKGGSYVELEVQVIHGTQKTLGTTKITEVTIKSNLTLDDISAEIIVGDRFSISDIDDKLGSGKILEVVLQK